MNNIPATWPQALQQLISPSSSWMRAKVCSRKRAATPSLHILLGIKHLVVCVNKMDLVDYSKDVFDKIEADYRAFAATLGVNKSPSFRPRP